MGRGFLRRTAVIVAVALTAAALPAAAAVHDDDSRAPNRQDELSAVLDALATDESMDATAALLADAIVEDPTIVERIGGLADCRLQPDVWCPPAPELPQDLECVYDENGELVCRLPEPPVDDPVDPDPTTSTTGPEPTTTTEPGPTTSTTEPEPTTTTEPEPTTTTSEPPPTTTTPPTSTPPTSTPPTTMPLPTTTPPTSTPPTSTPPTTMPPTTMPPSTTPSTTLPPTSTTAPPSTTSTTQPPAPPCVTRVPPRDLIDREILEERRRVAEGCWSLVASGDSVTSAHNQEQSGIPTSQYPCPGTKPIRTGIGNDHKFSYAHSVFTRDARFGLGSYYNFARTGFKTSDMRTATAATTDGCLNKWGDTIADPDLRDSSPFTLSMRAADYEHAKGRKVAWVTTGGVNNTNWVSLLMNFLACDMLGRSSQATRAARNLVIFTVTPTGQAAHVFNGGAQDSPAMRNLLKLGGTCRVRIRGGVVDTTLTVPKFDIAARAPAITQDITQMVSRALVGGVEKTVWVGYYDVALAVIETRGALASLGVPPATVDQIVQALEFAGIPATVALVGDAADKVTAQGYLKDLNDAICQGVALGDLAARLLLPGGIVGTATCTRWPDPAFANAQDIQPHTPGGSPHPSAAGHTKLADLVIGKLR